MHKPVRGKLTLTQWKHDWVDEKGNIIQHQDALDESPRGIADWRLFALQKGTVSFIQRADYKRKIDPYYVITFNNGDSEYSVHCEVASNVKVGFVVKSGGFIGHIAKKNPSGCASHRHHFILNKNRKPLDVLKYMSKGGVYPHDWLRDPNHLIPKGYILERKTLKETKPIVTPLEKTETQETILIGLLRELLEFLKKLFNRK